MKNLRIGLDIDGVLAGFWEAYLEFFNAKEDPAMLIQENISTNVEEVLVNEKGFWENLPVINMPDFIPELYCTKRVNSNKWTKNWLNKNEFPERTVLQMFDYSGNKADLVKGKVDVFIDDDIDNFIKLNLSGVPCLLMDTEQNRHWGPVGRLFSMKHEEIIECYELFMKTFFYNFKNFTEWNLRSKY